jgi:hypothetical protein
MKGKTIALIGLTSAALLSLALPAIALTSGFRFTVTTAANEIQRSSPYSTHSGCSAARADYIEFTPVSRYKSVSSCRWYD